jgi:hypothetical protein
MMRLSEWLALRHEGLLMPDRPPRKGMARINPFPTTDGQGRRLHVKSVKKPRPFSPTIRKVAEIVPSKNVGGHVPTSS